MLWKCSICAMVVEGDAPPAKCPKCDAASDKFVQLPQEAADKIYAADRTNDIHAQIISLASQIIALSVEGMQLNLDPPCLAAFTRTENEAWTIKQRSKAEIGGHVSSEQW